MRKSTQYPDSFQQSVSLTGFIWIIGLAFCLLATPASAALSITTGSPLDAATLNKAYAKNIRSSGGVPPLVWSKTRGSLPSGLVFAAGTIEGIPLEEGTFTFTIKVKDSRGPLQGGRQEISKSFNLTVGEKVPSVKALWDSGEISELSGNLDTTVSGLNSALIRTEGLQDVTDTVQDEWLRIRDDQEFLDILADVMQNVQQSVAEEQDGLQAFLYFENGQSCGEDSACAEFRATLIELIDTVSDLVAASSLETEPLLTRDLDLEGLKDAVRQAPGPALFPIYRAANNDLNLMNSGFVSSMQETVDSARLLAGMLQSSIEDGEYRSEGICGLMLAAPPVTRQAIWVTTRSAAKWKIIGSVVEAFEEVGFVDPEAGVKGFVTVSLSGGLTKSGVLLFKIWPEVLEKVALYAGHKMVYCTALAQKENVEHAIITNAFPASQRPGNNRGGGGS